MSGDAQVAARGLAAALLDWGDRTRRDLPWRRTRDPWAVLVSEVMLQQTQVIRVAARYDAFLDAFPTPSACAEAAPGDVLRQWGDLGFNRRAVALHTTARRIVEQHGGQVPDDERSLLALPGVGPYTARAVLAFAFERDVGVVDVNSGRVLARAVAGERLGRRGARRLADRFVPPGRGWEWNQSLLDLGATVCVRQKPRCAECPLLDTCAWATAGWPDPDPANGTAGASTGQGPFEGSDRQGRGRLVRAMRTGPVPVERLPDAAGWPEDPGRARRVADRLVAEGLAEYADGTLALPV